MRKPTGMKTFRIIFVNAVLLSLVVLISFGSLYVYKTNPKVHDLMHEMDKNISWEYLVERSLYTFARMIMILYSFYFILFHLFFRKKLTAGTTAISAVIILSLILITMYWEYMDLKLSRIPGAVISIAIFGGIGLSARAFLEYFNERDVKKELEKKNLLSELNLLRSQINPHFLFNTLNNIDALVRKDPEQASDLLIKLSVQMRYMLYDSNIDKISLVSEMEFIKDYISLQLLRIKNKEAIRFNVSGRFEDKLIAPMLFIPFIENAFKHCTDKDTDGAIEINIKEDNSKLSFFSQQFSD